MKAVLAAGFTTALADEDVIYRTPEEIQESGTVKNGVFYDKNPFGYVDENGTMERGERHMLRIDSSELKKLLLSENLGLEKEDLRVDEQGFLSHSPHPFPDEFVNPENRYVWKVRRQFEGSYVKKGLELARQRQEEYEKKAFSGRYKTGAGHANQRISQMSTKKEKNRMSGGNRHTRVLCRKVIRSSARIAAMRFPGTASVWKRADAIRFL